MTVTACTSSGRINGRHIDNTIAFLGIPYAKAPINRLRFKPPEASEGWTGIRECTDYGPRAIQQRALNPEPGVLYSEDCLNLNVWTPALDKEKRPVAFYIHGGGFAEGSNSEDGFSGAILSRGQNIVVVSANYRLGAFGFLYLGNTTGYEQSGNLGLLDQILALKWVRDNISAFGGDPDNVCIIGQSAGGKSVMSLIAAPAAKGLFHSAFAMSGAMQGIKTVETKAALAHHFMNTLHISERQILNVSARDIIRAQIRAHDKYIMFESYSPTADGIVLPKDLPAFIRNGHLNSVPLVMGYTERELYMDSNTPYSELSDAEMEKRMRWKFGDNGAYVYKQYLKLKEEKGFFEAHGYISSCYTYIYPCYQTAQLLIEGGYGFPIYMYRWSFGGAGIPNHSTDNEALFGKTLPYKRLGHERTWTMLEEYFHSCVTRFVEKKNPSIPNFPEWQPVSSDKQAQMVIDTSPYVENIDISAFDKHFPLDVMRIYTQGV